MVVQEPCARVAQGAKRERALRAARPVDVRDIPVIERVIRLHAGRNAERGESRQVGFGNQLRVLDPPPASDRLECV